MLTDMKGQKIKTQGGPIPAITEDKQNKWSEVMKKKR